MKVKFHLLLVFFSGLFIAVIVYPFLHEAGHSLMAIMVGAQVADIGLVPVPYIMCNLYGISDFGYILIGGGGMLFPFICAAIIHCKNFWMWYTGLALNVISVIAFGISVVACFMFDNDALVNEDIIKILSVDPTQKYLWVALLLVLIMCSVFRVVKSNPIKRCEDYFF